MSAKNKFVSVILMLTAAAMLTGSLFAQKPVLTTGKATSKQKKDPTPAPAEPTPTPTPADGKDGAKDPNNDGSPEAEAILPVYNNYLREYRLGPNDVITVEVFGQCPDYCKSNITVPPTAKISYPLIREGVMVGGKTVEQVAAEITKKLDEYIIDPKVTVTLDKAMSARFSVLGKVNTPGVRVLDRKVSVYEAIVDAGGVARDGDIRKVVIYSYSGQGAIKSRMVNLAELQAGRGEMVFLNPGDQVFVSGKGFSLVKVLQVIAGFTAFRGLAGIPF